MLFFFPLDVLDEICDLTESVSEGFLSYSFGVSFFDQYLQIILVDILVPVYG